MPGTPPFCKPPGPETSSRTGADGPSPQPLPGPGSEGSRPLPMSGVGGSLDRGAAEALASRSQPAPAASPGARWPGPLRTRHSRGRPIPVIPADARIRHSRESGNPLVFDLPGSSMDSRFRGNDESGAFAGMAGMAGEGAFAGMAEAGGRGSPSAVP